MAKVSVSLGFTIRIGSKQENQYVKVSAEVSEIDTEAPLDLQLGEINKVLDAAWKCVHDKVDEKLEAVFDEMDSK